MNSWEITGVIHNWTLTGACFKAFICFIQERLSMFLNLVGAPGGSWGSKIRDVSKGWSPGSSSLPLSAVLSALHNLPSPGSIHKFWVTVLVVPWLRLESNGMLSSDWDKEKLGSSSVSLKDISWCWLCARECPWVSRGLALRNTDVFPLGRQTFYRDINSYSNVPRGQAWHKSRKWASCKKTREGGAKMVEE